jgi:hypothetical protein
MPAQVEAKALMVIGISPSHFSLTAMLRFVMRKRTAGESARVQRSLRLSYINDSAAFIVTNDKVPEVVGP